MRFRWLVVLFVLSSAPAAAQVSTGVGAGVGAGARGANASGANATAFVEVALPVLPAVRGEAFLFDQPSGVGKMAVAVSGVIAAPIPVVTPYVIGGWGTYGLGAAGARGGWNVGVGARASLLAGPSLYVELRRHERVARDLLTVGVRF